MKTDVPSGNNGRFAGPGSASRPPRSNASRPSRASTCRPPGRSTSRPPRASTSRPPGRSASRLLHGNATRPPHGSGRGLAVLLLLGCLVLAHAGGSADRAGSGPVSPDRSAERGSMVREQIESRGVRNQQVLAAMQAVRRHHFVPADQVAAAYQDRPLPIGFGQTISQPYIVAFMTELLMLEGAERVLEIGTGSGYQAAVLAEITPHVFTIEIIPELAARAASWLRAEGYIGIQVKSGDGYHGWPEHGPYDRIIVTAAAGHVPPPLIEQLKPGGRIVIPVGGVFDVQQLTVVDKHADGSLTTRQVLPVRFVPLTGQGLAPDG